MIWIIMMNVFIVAAGAGGDRWLMKTIMTVSYTHLTLPTKA